MEPTTKLENRNDLYNAIWSEPMVHVAARLGLSDVGLAKLCHRLKVPVPGRGYWAKVKAGAKVQKRPLSDQEADNPHDIWRLQRAFSRAMDLISAKDQVKENFGHGTANNQALGSATVHPLVTASRAWIERSGLRTDQIRRKHLCIAIAVSPAQLERASQIMSLAIEGLEARGIKVEVSKPVEAKDGPETRSGRESLTVANVHSLQIPFELFEEEEMVEMAPAVPPKLSKNGFPLGPGKPAKMESLPTGKLVLRINDSHRYGLRRRWGDRKTVPLEDQIPTFVEAVLVLGERWKQEEEEWARRRAQWDEEARIRRCEKDREEMTTIMVHDIHDRTKDWLTGQDIKAFLAAFETHHSSESGGVRPSSELAAWIYWAYLHSDSLQKRALEVLDFRRPPSEQRFTPWR